MICFIFGNVISIFEAKSFFFFFFAYLEYLLIRPTAVPSWTPRGLQNTEIQNPEIGKP